MSRDFVKEMEAAKKNKLDRRNRGLASGDFRGTVRPRPLEEEPEWWLEREFAKIARGLAHIPRGLSWELGAIVADLNGATFDDCPF
jgi:hypothetical protein